MSDDDIDAMLDAGPADAGVGRFLFGSRFGMEPFEVSAANLAHFVSVGGRLVETAHSYARGKSKEALGQWLRANPGRLAVVTKVGHDMQGGDIPLDRELVTEHLTESLRALGVDSVDVMMYHCDDPRRTPEELADTLLGLVEAGYARRIGASNWSPRRLDALATVLAARGHRAVASYHFSLADPDPALLGDTRYADAETLSVVQRHQLPLLSWSAQAQGFFSRSAPRPADRGPDPFDTQVNRARRQRCVELAERLGARPETVALAWTVHHPFAWPSIGPKTPEQLDRSLAALDLELTEAEVRWLHDGTD